MSRGPAVHEIFKHQAVESNQAFRYEEQETKEQLMLGKKKTAAPMPPMKKFGGYKPKILGGQEDFIEMKDDAAPKTNGSVLNAKTRPAPIPQLTKPKPWVIGDKNVPMVLGSADGDDNDIGDNDDNNNNVEQQHENANIYNSVIENDDEKLHENNMGNSGRTYSVSSSETSTLIPTDAQEPKQGIDNPAAIYSNDSVSMNGSESAFTPMNTDDNHQHSMTNNGRPDDFGEPEGVFIPAPDYDEDEQTLDFTSEDTDDGGEDSNRTRQQKPKPVVFKEYGGADLSHYLSDDEGDNMPPVPPQNEAKPNGKNKKFSTEARRPKVSEKHSLFKQQPASTRSKRKGSGKSTAPAFNSVRSFSYADSKFGTKGKAAGKSMSFTELTDDSEKFLNTNDHASSYESFLRSRHGEAALAQGYNDTDVEMRGGGNGGVQLRNKDESMLKRLTLRVKNRMSKNLST